MSKWTCPTCGETYDQATDNAVDCGVWMVRDWPANVRRHWPTGYPIAPSELRVIQHNGVTPRFLRNVTPEQARLS